MHYLQMQDLYHLVSVWKSQCLFHFFCEYHCNLTCSTLQLSSLVTLKARNWIVQYGIYQLFMPMLVIMLRWGFLGPNQCSLVFFLWAYQCSLVAYINIILHLFSIES